LTARKLASLNGHLTKIQIKIRLLKLVIIAIVPSPLVPSPISRNVSIPAMIGVVSFLPALNRCHLKRSTYDVDKHDIP
jgi:hypothetical protein